MNVEVVESTVQPPIICGAAAGVSRGLDQFRKFDISGDVEKQCFRRIKNCLDRGHTSILEHASATWFIQDVSRITTHQLVRHRIASYVEKSLRYTKVDPNAEEDYFVTPPAFKDAPEEILDMYYDLYLKLIDSGVPRDEARYVLPMSTSTDICVTMNMREFFAFLDLRLSRHASKEMQTLAWKMLDSLATSSSRWYMFLNEFYIQHGDNKLAKAYVLSIDDQARAAMNKLANEFKSDVKAEVPKDIFEMAKLDAQNAAVTLVPEQMPFSIRKQRPKQFLESLIDSCQGQNPFVNMMEHFWKEGSD